MKTAYEHLLDISHMIHEDIYVYIYIERERDTKFVEGYFADHDITATLF
jgi:hypothetical protein